MSNVISIGCTRDYLVSHAARHRRAGRYDEAMALLGKAQDAYGIQEDVEMESARVYAEMGCDDEAARAYLRVVRLNGRHKAEALFDLSLYSAQRGDFTRSVSYYEQFMACPDASSVPQETAALLGRELLEEIERKPLKSRKARARMLEHRAAERLQEGKPAAAEHLMEHALRLHETAQGYTLLACCHLMRLHPSDAAHTAERAHRMAPGRVQTLCVLADAYASLGDRKAARRMMHIAAMRAAEPDDFFAVAMESAKYDEDGLTLLMTRRLLAREPFHTQGMRLRACALVNLGRTKEAARLFGRLCGLLPENTVCAYYYKYLREGQAVPARLALAADVPREEGIRRASELMAQLYISPDEICADEASVQRICRLCNWALYSPMAGVHTKTVALILLNALPAQSAREMLLDALTDPRLPDSMKLGVLQGLTGKEGFQPFYADIGGRLAQLAAGGVSSQPMKHAEMNSQIVQRVSDALSGTYPDAPQKLLSLFLRYLEVFPQPKGREADGCAAALECLYHRQSGRHADERTIAWKNGVTTRWLHRMLRRFARCLSAEQPEE